MRNIALLGSTGSIGKNALDIISSNRDNFRLISLAAGTNIGLLREQIKEFSPVVVCVKNKADCEQLKKEFPGKKVYYGKNGLLDIISESEVDTVISAISGTDALAVTLLAIKKNMRICLANKETLVAGGPLINAALKDSEAEIIPIDSEQSAIFQAIGLNNKKAIRKIILTASGGPFFKLPLSEFSKITVDKALSHPTWSMGEKITIDSATLMNKALEIIEAYYLFNIAGDKIEVVIHPQSIIHSMVEFIDSSIISQLSLPDMRIPILYSLTYPDRIEFPHKQLDFKKVSQLDFYELDRKKFSSIDMAYHVIKEGNNAGAVFNAANEVAVEHFLHERIYFNDIFSAVAEILYNEKFFPIRSLDDIEDTIITTKRKTEQFLKSGVNR